jgi:hypothetical protein
MRMLKLHCAHGLYPGSDGRCLPDGHAGFEARGLIFGAPLALALGAAFVPLRKPGKLPGAIGFGVGCATACRSRDKRIRLTCSTVHHY